MREINLKRRPTALLLLALGAALVVAGMLLTSSDQFLQAQTVQDLHAGEGPAAGAGVGPGSGSLTAEVSADAGSGLPFTGFGVIVLAAVAAGLIALGGVLRRGR